MILQTGRIDAGLLLSLLGSLLSLPIKKRYHIALGIVFTVLTLIHTWQHRRNISNYMQKEQLPMDFLSRCKRQIVPTKTALLLKNVEVLHYIPGRVRLYSKYLVNNSQLVEEVRRQLQAIPEILSFSINPATGSVLIQYQPEKAAQNAELRELEYHIAEQMRRK